MRRISYYHYYTVVRCVLESIRTESEIILFASATQAEPFIILQCCITIIARNVHSDNETEDLRTRA